MPLPIPVDTCYSRQCRGQPLSRSPAWLGALRRLINAPPIVCASHFLYSVYPSGSGNEEAKPPICPASPAPAHHLEKPAKMGGGGEGRSPTLLPNFDVDRRTARGPY